MRGDISFIVAWVCISQVTNYVDYLHVLNYLPCIIFAEMSVNNFLLFNLKKSEDLIYE